VTLDRDVYQPFIEHCGHRPTRWNVWQAFNNRASYSQDDMNLSNHKIIDDIRRNRLLSAFNGLLSLLFVMPSADFSVHFGGGGRSGTMSGRSPRCFFLVLLKRSIPKPDARGKDVIQRESFVRHLPVIGRELVGVCRCVSECGEGGFSKR